MPLLVIALLLILLDFVWLKNVTGPMFSKMVTRIQGTGIELNLGGALLSYACLVIGIYWFGYRNIDAHGGENIWLNALPAGLFGLLGYGLFDFTNIAIFKGYEWKPALVDVAWGGALCYATAVGSYKILNK